MTISSSMNAGISGLTANANQLATIADNISNSSTYGYKRAETDFYSMVLGSDDSSSYTAGGVRTTSARMIDEGGALTSTTSATDIAVDGSGFIPVTTVSAAEADSGSYPVSLVTTGSFYTDENGLLRTSTGEVLMGWPANADGTFDDYARDSVDSLSPVNVNSNQYVANPTTEVSMSANLPATATEAGAETDPVVVPIEYYDNLGTTESLTLTFTPVVAETGEAATNTWTLVITDSAQSEAVIGEYTLEFDESQDAGGRLIEVTTLSGGEYDSETGSMDLEVAGGTISLSIGAIGGTDGLSQLSDSYYPGTVSANGSEVGTLVSVEFAEGGVLNAVYDTGDTRAIWKVPVVEVSSTAGLVSSSNQTYQMSSASGSYYLWDAGTGPTGEIVGNTLEESATDIATELTQMIETQRAYSASSKVITTADEMLEEATNLKR
jgi:flagellar hook protein FlgE